MAVGSKSRRLALAALVIAAELAALAGLTVATAQMFDDRFPFIEERRRRGGSQPGGFGFPGLFGDQKPAPAPVVDASRAPSPKKVETPPQTTVVVLGDSMADWLAYGLETAAAESPDIGILRRHKTLSGLNRAEVKNDPRGDHPDWPQAAKDILNADKPHFVVMMVGLNDRKPIREAEAAAPPAAPAVAIHEFRSDKWAELYIKRIDETIAALKSKNLPVFWVGLPPIRGTRSASDISYLNDLYRSRAEKAGITYVDTWDGFVDDAGRFVTQGPDFEGQIRRLRAGDGVHFTQAGARKLAHFVEREIQRALMTRTTPVALPIPDEPVPAPAPAPAAKAGPIPRPLAGPAVPLTSAEGDGETVLLGGPSTRSRAPTPDPATVKVLVRGEPLAAPAGRADDFAWPRRDVAPLGADPIVATTTTPPRQIEQRRQVATQEARPDAAAAAPGEAAPKKPAPRPTAARQQQTSRVSSFFGGVFGQQQPQQPQRRLQQPPQQHFFPFFSR